MIILVSEKKISENGKHAEIDLEENIKDSIVREMLIEYAGEISVS